MGGANDPLMFREDYPSGDERAGSKPTLFERFKRWRSSDAGVDDSAAEPTFKTSKELVPQFRSSHLPPHALPPSATSVLQTPSSLEMDFRDEFSSRLEEIMQPREAAHIAQATLGEAKPADDALYLHEVAAEERHRDTQALTEVMGNLDEVAKLLESIHDRMGETSQRGSELHELFQALPEVVQALPAIGRGQLSLLSGIASEQRAVGANLAERMDRQGERVLDLVSAIEAVQEQTGEVVRSVDELREVLASLPGSLQAEAETLDATRKGLDRLTEQSAQLSTTIATAFERQEDVLMEGFVNQTVALEEMKTAVTTLADRFAEGLELQRRATEAAELAATREPTVVAATPVAAAETPAEDNVVYPVFGSNRWQSLAIGSAAAAFLVILGFGVAALGSSGNDQMHERTAQMLTTLEEERSLLKEQMATMQDHLRQTAELAAEERTDYMDRLANLMEMNEEVITRLGELKNDKEMLAQRVKRLDAENRALRGDMRADASTADPSARPRPE